MSRARDIADGTLNSADINGGNIDNTTIGGTTPAAGTFTTFTSTGIDDNLTSGGPAVTIDSSGNVGIGASNPDAKLMVSESVNNTASALFYNTAGAAGNVQGKGYIGFSFAQSWNYHGAEIGWDQEATTGYRHALTFSTRGNSDVRPTERMRIDSSGKILASAGTNWVGTVSENGQSSIIERGSNPNGEYVKFADGTMICSGEYIGNPGVTWTSAPSGNYYYYALNRTHAITFHTDPSVFVGRYLNGTGLGWAIARDVTTTSVNFTLYDDSNRSNQNVTIRYTAIGRWY